MADGTNFVLLRGNLGADPEIRATPSGKQVASLRLATSRSWKSDNGRESRVEWHRITVWGQTAEFLGTYAKKGDMLEIVGGEIQTRKYQASDGSDRYSTDIVVNYPNGRVNLIGRVLNERDTDPGRNRTDGGTTNGAPAPAAPTFDDDIPF